jgi:hypothetical protein
MQNELARFEKKKWLAPQPSTEAPAGSNWKKR